MNAIRSFNNEVINRFTWIATATAIATAATIYDGGVSQDVRQAYRHILKWKISIINIRLIKELSLLQTLIFNPFILQPNYFKLKWILLVEITQVWKIKGLQHQIANI